MFAKCVDIARRLMAVSLIRYIFSGGILFLIDLSVFMGLVQLLELVTPLAQACSRTVGAATGFALHKVFTFRNEEKKASVIATQGTGYIATTVFTIFVSSWVVVLFEYLIPSNLFAVKVLTEIVMVCMTYVMLRFIFKQRRVETTVCGE